MDGGAMTEQEAHALTQLLQRTPLTAAEALWVSGLIQRVTKKEEKPPAPSNGKQTTEKLSEPITT
jgi:hypothetical protein